MATVQASDAPRIDLGTDFATLKFNEEEEAEEGNVAPSSSSKGTESRTEQ